MTPSLRSYVLLNRLWFFGMTVLVMILAWFGVDVVPILLISAGFAGGTTHGPMPDVQFMP